MAAAAAVPPVNVGCCANNKKLMAAPSNKVADAQFSVQEKYKTFGEAYQHDPEFKGPAPNRSCTDIFCLVLYLIFTLIGMAIAVFAYSRGNPALLAYPTDSQGKLCGFNELQSRPYLFYFDLLHCVRNIQSLPFLGCTTTQICVETCPNTTWSWMTLSVLEMQTKLNPTQRKKELVCVDEVDFSQEKWLSMSVSNLVRDGYCAPYTIPQTPVLKRCMPNFLVDALKGDLNHVDNATTLVDAKGKEFKISDLGSSKDAFDSLMQVQQWGERVLADIRECWPHLLCFVGFALIFAFVWIVLLRFIAPVIVWSTITLFLLMWLFGVVFCFWRYNLLAHVIDIPTPPGELAKFTAAISFQTSFDSANLWLAMGIICGVILLVSLILLCFLGSRIRLAVKLFEETSKALGHMPSALIWPFIPFAFQMATIGWAGAAAICLATLGRAQFLGSQPNSTYKGLIPLPDSLTDCNYAWELTAISNFSENAVGKVESAVHFSFISANESSAVANRAVAAVNKTLAEACHFFKYNAADYAIYFQIYNAFMFFWHTNFITGASMVTLAGAFGTYYWAFKKPDDIPPLPLLKGFWRAVRFHLGSVAFGSLLIAIVQIIRLILEYAMYKMKGTHNFVGVFILKCLQCLFSCLEKLVKFIARKAYIMIAIHGKNFCASAKEGWQLIMRNFIRAAVLTGVSRFLITISVLIITGGMTVFSYFYFHGEIPIGIPVLVSTWPTLNFFYVPVVIVAIASFAIAVVCLYVYDLGVETMFLCFLEDCERNDGTHERPYFMSKNLASALR